VEERGHGKRIPDNDNGAAKQLQVCELAGTPETRIQRANVGLVGKREVKLEDESEGVRAYFSAEDPASANVEGVNRSYPRPDVDNGVERLVGKSTEVQFGIDFTQDEADEGEQ